MKYHLYFIIILLCVSNSFAQNWTTLYRGGKVGESPNAQKIQILDSSNIFVTIQNSNRYCIIHSSNKGNSWDTLFREVDWDQQPIPMLLNINDYCIVTPKLHFLAFFDAGILKISRDSGKTFSRIFLDSNAKNSGIQRLIMYDTLTGIAQTKNAIYVTFDCWKTWEARIPFKKSSLNSARFIDSNNIRFIYRGSYYINKSQKYMNYNIKTDEYTELFEFYKDTNKTYFENCHDFDIVNNNTIYAAGNLANGNGNQSRDIIYKSTNGGFDWTKIYDQENVPVFGLFEISFYDEFNGIAVGQGSKILFTKDAGKTWVYDNPKEMHIGQDSTYGAFNLHVEWAGRNPIIATYGGNIFRYDGNFFEFNSYIAPFLILPVNFSINNYINPTFKWSKLNNVQKYNFRLSKDSNFSSILIDSLISTDSIIIKGLQYNSVYYWKVSALYSDTSISSSIFRFKTIPEFVNTIYPPCDTTLHSKIIIPYWKAIEGAINYQISIFSGDNMIYDMIENDTTASIPFYAIGSGKYCYIIKAVTGSTNIYSKKCCFYVDTNSTNNIEELGASECKLYPNPVENILFIQSDFKDKEINTIEIYNSIAILVKKEEINPQNNKTYQVNIEKLAPGSYFLVLNKHLSKTFIKY